MEVAHGPTNTTDAVPDTYLEVVPRRRTGTRQSTASRDNECSCWATGSCQHACAQAGIDFVCVGNLYKKEAKRERAWPCKYEHTYFEFVVVFQTRQLSSVDDKTVAHPRICHGLTDLQALLRVLRDKEKQNTSTTTDF